MKVTDSTSALAPFFMGNSSTMWTSNNARSAASLCYYYNDVDSQDSTVEQVIGVINDLYGSGCAFVSDSAATSTLPSPAPFGEGNSTRLGVRPRGVRHPASAAIVKLTQNLHNLVTDDGAVREYVVNVEMDSMALGGSASIYFFDAPIGDDVRTWPDCSGFIGKRTFLVKPSRGNQGGQLKVAALSLNSALIERVKSGKLGGMGNNEVTWYLKQKLHWKVVKVSAHLKFGDQHEHNH